MSEPIRLVKRKPAGRTTEAQKRAIKKHRERKKADGICVSCTKDATNGVYCADHRAASNARSGFSNFERRRVPTFDDFCRLEDGE